jgi:hypothetical protein
MDSVAIRLARQVTCRIDAVLRAVNNVGELRIPDAASIRRFRIVFTIAAQPRPYACAFRALLIAEALRLHALQRRHHIQLMRGQVVQSTFSVVSALDRRSQ